MTQNNTKIILDFEPISRRIFYTPNLSIYDALTQSGVRISSLCGGKGTCGKCKILIQTGSQLLTDPTNSEREQLNDDEIGKGWRLACQVKLDPTKIIKSNSNSTGIRIFLPDELLIEDFKILTSGVKKTIEILPNIKKLFLKIQKPSLNDPIPDFERILGTKQLDVTPPIQIEYGVLKKLPDILRTKDHDITLTFRAQNTIIDCESGDTSNDAYGIAFDIGTTTIVGYLMSLKDGKTYSISSTLNPQTAFGEDVITRITHARDDPKGLENLNALVVEALNKIIEKTSKEANVSLSNIYEASIVGNSVMHHLFLGINPIYIGLSPYVPAIQTGLNIDSRSLGLKMAPNGNTFMLPLIAGFVGADTIGVIISSEIDKEKELTLAIDIGTNGEIIIGNKDLLVTGSCAAGSALEGAHISNGMRAAAGAIDSVKIDPQSFFVEYSTINDKKPMGICGSGLIDSVAEMLRSKIITRSGRFNKEFFDHKRFLKKEKNIEFILVPREETSTGNPIVISQKDIREIQMAKGAFYSGTNLILNYLDQRRKKNHQINQIFLAGAFGNYIDKRNAKFIGMIPDIVDDKIYQIGNAAGMGAQHCLINTNLRKKSQELLKKIEYVEIAIQKNFQREYAEAMYFPHLNLNNFPTLTEYQDIPKR
ncbi:MAG: DUF4445 domain-containing protein [Promethearchaeota archaeon]|nr:MAG: DUF4445 domain-containing protein [Candidatus Lokiarchaeota archaeon]